MAKLVQCAECGTLYNAFVNDNCYNCGCAEVTCHAEV